MRKAILLAVSIVLAKGGAGMLCAQVIEDDFDDGDDTEWDRLEPLQDVGGSASFTFPNGDSYRISSEASPDPTALGPARAGSYRPDASYEAFHIEVDIVAWDNSFNQDIGILARVSDPGLGTLNGYAWAYETGPGEAYLSRVDGEAPAVLACAPVILHVGESYRLVFEGFDSELQGQIFSMDDLENPLVTLGVFDNVHPAGFCGVFNNAAVDDGATDSTFDNYRSSSRTDVDSDGLLDQWEWDHFGSLVWFEDDDNDNDGQTNLEEFLGGSDPNDAASHSGKLTVSISEEDVVVSFRRLEERVYQLETSPDLREWTPRPEAEFSEDGAVGRLSLPHGGAPSLFVRVRVFDD